MRKIFIVVGVMFLLGTTLEAKKYCKNMKNCQEACKYYNGGDYRLDRDNDGIPCENVCSKPCKKPKKKSKKKS